MTQIMTTQKNSFFDMNPLESLDINEPIREVEFVSSGRNDASGRRSVSVSDRIARLELDPRKKAALARARRRISTHYQNEAGQETLKSLRLAHGFSQVELARRLGTHQPYIATIESGDPNLKFSTLQKLASIFCISVPRLAEIVDSQSKSQKFVTVESPNFGLPDEPGATYVLPKLATA